MADNVDDVGSLIGKSNSSNNISLKQIDLTQIHHQQRIFDDAEHITTSVSTTSEKDDLPCLLANYTPRASSLQNDMQSKKEKRQLIIATTLCFFFMFAEILGGYMAGSLAIMSDAAHLLSDCISFIVALLAIILSKKSPDNYMTFGYKRIEVLGAILSIFGIWLLTTFLFYFALNRLLYQDFDIDADTMMIVSSAGIVINIVMAIILHGDGICCFKHVRHHHNHNCHSHSTHKDETYHNNNRTKFEYKPLLNESSDKLNGKKVPKSMPSSLLNCKNKHKHNLLHRSPDRSRTNSLSHTISYANGNTSGSSDMIRRNSHGTPTPNSIKMNGFHHDLPSNDHLDIDLKDDRVPIAKDLITIRDCITNGSTICPIHHYVHRDSSEHTPIGSSESEDIHDNQCRRNSFSMAHSHHSPASNHSHDFASKNINIQAAVIHVLGDFIQSIGVFISAIIIKNYPHAKVADPLCTFVFSIIVMMTTCTIMKDSIGIILEAVPNSINSERLSEDLNCIDGVESVHNLNVWSLTAGWNVMTVHLIIDPYVRSTDILYVATTIAQNGYNIKQCTIQIEEHPTIDRDEIIQDAPLVKSHSVMSDNENSIINILT